MLSILTEFPRIPVSEEDLKELESLEFEAKRQAEETFVEIQGSRKEKESNPKSD